MRKYLFLIIQILLLFIVVGCNKNEPSSVNSSKIEDSISSELSEKEEKTLVLYFSCTNNTKTVALKINKAIDSTIEEIKPVNPYTSADLNYNNSNCRANQEQNDQNARPEFVPLNIDISEYDNIFIGYPIWWGKLPKIMYTMFDAYDFTNKTIIPFCTSGSSSISASVNEIKQLEPEANVLMGKRFSSNTSDTEIETWINSLNL